jgi:hypothetical protein
MALLRVRISSFLAGFGVAAGLGLYQLRQDVLQSHEVLAQQVTTAGLLLFSGLGQAGLAHASKITWVTRHTKTLADLPMMMHDLEVENPDASCRQPAG